MIEKKLAQAPQKSGDRKRKGASEAPRKVMAFRVSDSLYKKLETASQGRGFSLSEEIEARLEQSFRDAAEPFIDTALRMASANCFALQELTGKTIAEDLFTRMACAKAAATAIEFVGGLADTGAKDTPEFRALLQGDVEAVGTLLPMFLQLKKDGIQDEYAKGLGTMVQHVLDRRQAAERHRELLAQALREGAPQPPEAPELPLPADPPQPTPAPKRRRGKTKK